jgi:hypothetical protein
MVNIHLANILWHKTAHLALRQTDTQLNAKLPMSGATSPKYLLSSLIATLAFPGRTTTVNNTNRVNHSSAPAQSAFEPESAHTPFFPHAMISRIMEEKVRYACLLRRRRLAAIPSTFYFQTPYLKHD